MVELTVGGSSTTGLAPIVLLYDLPWFIVEKSNSNVKKLKGNSI